MHNRPLAESQDFGFLPELRKHGNPTPPLQRVAFAAAVTTASPVSAATVMVKVHTRSKPRLESWEPRILRYSPPRGRPFDLKCTFGLPRSLLPIAAQSTPSPSPAHSETHLMHRDAPSEERLANVKRLRRVLVRGGTPAGNVVRSAATSGLDERLRQPAASRSQWCFADVVDPPVRSLQSTGDSEAKSEIGSIDATSASTTTVSHCRHRARHGRRVSATESEAEEDARRAVAEQLADFERRVVSPIETPRESNRKGGGGADDLDNN